eukprot:122112-Chlamydomonas_euryale.AAC.4
MYALRTHPSAAHHPTLWGGGQVYKREMVGGWGVWKVAVTHPYLVKHMPVPSQSVCGHAAHEQVK